MPWRYSQSTGVMTDPTGVALAPPGYAGRDQWKNRPAMQNVASLGPLPRGRYLIGFAHPDQRTGPLTLDLIPAPQNQMFGRSLFRIHGDSISEPGNASDGCIVQSLAIRTTIEASDDRILDVVE